MQKVSREDILGTIADLARQKLDWQGELRPEMRLIEDLELDSIRLMTLAMEVEDHFEVCIDEDEEGSIETVGHLTELVWGKLGA